MSRSLPERPPVLAGHSYIRLLGRGGFADVFLFEQNMPRRSVAVKVLHHNVIDQEVVRMFNAEADVMARLGAHPSIVTVYDASISADGRPYLVMELCPKSMGSVFRTETIQVADVLNIGVKIASALESAISAGVLHRDIKPSNVLITTFGTPVLADFGIAASLAEAQRDDVVAMSVPWSAPEVVEERTSGTVASEVWALGATLYTLLAGRSPFEQTGRNGRDELIARISKARYTPIGRADVPQRLEQILMRSMDPNPARRHSSPLEIANDLRYVQYELGIMPTPLEVASEGWSSVAGSGGLDFNDATVRGPVISTVATSSNRKKSTAGKPVSRSMTADDIDAMPIPTKSAISLKLILAIAIPVVVLAAGALVAAIVIAGM